ncbi:MAG: cell envelope integrity protein TolA [Gammaproteobacteria bacterium]|nr:MAG: cell envelope integrity protein TolA [Gammaproteobacteria bacterium]
MWKIIRENPRAVLYAVLMHLVLLVLLVFSLDWTPKISRPAGVKVPIEAKLIDQRQLESVEEKKKEEQRKREAERKAVEEKKKAEAERKRKAEAEAKRKAEAEAKRKAEAEAKRKAEVKRKTEAEAKRKAEAEAAQRREAELALQQQLAAEQAERDQGVVAEYTAYIQDKIQQNWLKPAGSPEGLSCTVQVSLIPGGDVARVQIVRSSGDPLFDRSVETAVHKASPMPLPKDAAMFKYFRELRLIFKPR